MRLRTVLAFVAVLGALGALALAADIYRRILAAELATDALHASAAGAQLFAMVHVLGTAAVGVLLLAIALLIVNEPAPQTTVEQSAVAPAAPISAAPPVPTLFDALPAEENAPKAPEALPVVNPILVVAVPSTPAPTEVQTLSEPIELSKTEMNRAVDFERVWREQHGDVPTLIPLPPESGEHPAEEPPAPPPSPS